MNENQFNTIVKRKNDIGKKDIDSSQQDIDKLEKEEFEHYSFSNKKHDALIKEIVGHFNDGYSPPKLSLKNRKGFTEINYSRISRLFSEDKICEKIEENKLSGITEDKYVKSYFKPLNENTVKKWFSDDNGKKRQKNPSDRADLFKLGFVLGLDEEKFAEFCHKPFCQKHCVNHPVEYCMIYCMRKERENWYWHALKLYAKAKANAENITRDDNTKESKEIMCTRVVLDQFRNEMSEDVFVSYLAENMASMEPSLEKIDEEYKRECKRIFDGKDKAWSFYKSVIKDNYEDITSKHKQRPRNDDAIYVFEEYIYPKSNATKEKLYKDLVVSQPNKNDNDNTSSNAYIKARKKLISAHFFRYFIVDLLDKEKDKEKKYEEHFSFYTSYRDDINSLLGELNLPPLYYLDPFDRLYLICAKTQNPILTFYDVLLEIYKI